MSLVVSFVALVQPMSLAMSAPVFNRFVILLTGWVFAPPDMMFHQHFNAGAEPVRYIAFTHGSVRYPLTEHMRRVYAKVDVDAKKGGNQIEYADQDPRIHRMFVDELAKKGVAVRMNEFVTASTA